MKAALAPARSHSPSEPWRRCFSRRGGRGSSKPDPIPISVLNDGMTRTKEVGHGRGPPVGIENRLNGVLPVTQHLVSVLKTPGKVARAATVTGNGVVNAPCNVLDEFQPVHHRRTLRERSADLKRSELAPPSCPASGDAVTLHPPAPEGRRQVHETSLTFSYDASEPWIAGHTAIKDVLAICDRQVEPYWFVR